MTHYYDRSNLTRIPDLMKLAPQAASSFLAFEQEVYHGSNVIPPKIKELIAVAVAHVTGCPYCIDVHVQKCKKHGGTQEEIVSAVMIAASTRAGAVLSHATHAIIAYENALGRAEAAEEQTSVSPGSPGQTAAPDCFC
ncbi:carboxymuconolactone decarboxylase family protein [Paenibacillus thalictri]|uniref:Carboxymuconolactone decarboxylase family protein n=1 Tax=Paenibacillus thalictri TaxID=2527873 RepID=A0A4Q9DK55_9BACL|nr:carboxymuconolactone decarboxylase family protein [Paenibacillus thalictri]TBL73948.1 carboxymuconolactone decarboxylase family protein [Paenibacillus thalictri]